MNQPNSEDQTFRRLKRTPLCEVKGLVDEGDYKGMNLGDFLESMEWTVHEYFKDLSLARKEEL